MQLQLLSFPEVAQFLRTNDIIVIPIGSTEQHGPTGLLGTDALCPQGIAWTASDRQPNDIMVGPTFHVGSAQHHLGFAGSITLRPSTMIAAMNDWTSSLVGHGFRKIYWLNGHGGNIAPAKAAFAEWYAASSLSGGDSRVSLTFRNWWELPKVFEMCKELYGAGHGSHATPSEVAVTYALYPQVEARLRPEGKLNPVIAPTGSFGDAADYRRRFPDGRIGSDPTLANSADGQRIIDLAVEGLLSELKTLAKESEV